MAAVSVSVEVCGLCEGLGRVPVARLYLRRSTIAGTRTGECAVRVEEVAGPPPGATKLCLCVLRQQNGPR